MSFRLLTEYHSFLCWYRTWYSFRRLGIKFPSPCGVLFILIELRFWLRQTRTWHVSVSLWSIIYSYIKTSKKWLKKQWLSFRLLAEYYSFLWTNKYSLSTEDDILKFPSPYGVSFILIYMENFTALQQEEFIKFPSPYRVSFILIY